MQGPRSGMPCRSSSGGFGGSASARRAAQHRDQVLVVGAVELALVGERARLALSLRIPYCAQAGSCVGAPAIWARCRARA